MKQLLGVALVSVRRHNPRKLSWTMHETHAAADKAARDHMRLSTIWRFAYRVNVYARNTA